MESGATTPGPGDSDRVPWAMQVAVLADRQHPASEVDTAEAVARAVVGLLDDPRSRVDADGLPGPWAERVDHWRDGRIRKLVRRARGARWSDAQRLEGVTVEQNGAAARAFVPGPVRPLPPELAKMQVEGTTFPDDASSTSTDAMVLVGVSPHIEITSGKLAAQCGHAAQLAYEAMDAGQREAWRADGFRVCVRHVTPDQWDAGDWQVSVTDAGFTELDGPTDTTRARWQSPPGR